MRISVSDADGQLTELVRLAKQGEEVVLTQDGRAAVRLEPVRKPPSPEEKRAMILKLQGEVYLKQVPPGPDAARSQDFLYDDCGLPE